jgi:F-type H+/Na+-transporting ATPase subunit alpha
VLKQQQYQPLTVASQVAILFAATRGLLDAVDLADVGEWEKGFHAHLATRRPGILASITEQKDITKDIEAELIDAAEEYQKDFAARAKPAAGVVA